MANQVRAKRVGVFCLAMAMFSIACAPPPGRSDTSSQGSAARVGEGAAKFTRITAAVRADLPTLNKTLNTIIPGATGLDRLVSAGLTSVDDQSILHPQLAEAVPALDNGLWKLFPDGRMELTWRIRP